MFFFSSLIKTYQDSHDRLLFFYEYSFLRNKFVVNLFFFSVFIYGNRKWLSIIWLICIFLASPMLFLNRFSFHIWYFVLWPVSLLCHRRCLVVVRTYDMGMINDRTHTVHGCEWSERYYYSTSDSNRVNLDAI